MAVAQGGRAVVGIRVPGHPPILEAYLGGVKVWDGHVNQIKQIPYAVATASAEAPVVRGAADRPAPRALGYAEAISGADVSTGAMIAAPVMAATATAPTPDTIREHFFEIVASLEMTAQAYAPEGGASAGVLLFTDSAEGSAVAYPADPSASAAVTVSMVGSANVDVYAPSAAMVFIADPNTAAAPAMAHVPVVSGAQILTAPLSTATAVDYAPDAVADSMPEAPTAAATGAAPVPDVLAGEGEGVNPPVAAATAAVPVPDNVGGSSSVTVPVSTATADDYAPDVTATSLPDVPAAVGTGAAPVPVVFSGAGDGVFPDAAAAAAAAPVPDNVGGSSTIIAMLSMATAEDLVPVVTATSDVPGETAAATAMGREPVIRGDQIQVVPTQGYSTASAIPPDVVGNSGVDVPVSTATALAPVPYIGGLFQPKGGQRNASLSLGGSYAKVPLTTALTAQYPGSVIVNGGIQLDFTGLVRITLDCTTTGSSSGYQQIFMPVLDDTAVPGVVAGAGTRGVRHHEWDIDVLAGQVVSIAAYRTGTSSVTADPFTVTVTLPI